MSKRQPHQCEPDGREWEELKNLLPESEEELKSRSMKVKESEKAGLQLSVQKTKIMKSGPMANTWGNNGSSERLYLGSKITADGDCSHEIRGLLLLGRKAVTDLDSVLRSRDVTLPANVCLVKAMVFPIVM